MPRLTLEQREAFRKLAVGYSNRELARAVFGGKGSWYHRNLNRAMEGEKIDLRFHTKMVAWIEEQRKNPTPPPCRSPLTEAGEQIGVFMDPGKLNPGLKVRTRPKLRKNARDFQVEPHIVNARRPKAKGELISPVPGCSGDVWFVLHADGKTAAYLYSELIPQPVELVRTSRRT
jgi:hypothetical protein